MSEMSRRDFLRGALALGAAAVAGDLARGRPSSDGKETQKTEPKEPAPAIAEKTPSVEVKPPAPSSRFLGEEIEMLSKDMENEEKRGLVLAELKRIEIKEADKLSKIRFGDDQAQREKYFKPFLEKKEKIEAAMEAADPGQKVPRAVIRGIIGMESGGKNAFNPATGAAGIFQMTAETARSLGLKVNEKNDERLNLAKAAQAAVKYLLELFERFGGQWGLALAAYAGGPTKLENRLRAKFGLKKDTITSELLRDKMVNIVTLYSREFKYLGKYHSIQYPFGAQAMAQWMDELTEREKKDERKNNESALARL